MTGGKGISFRPGELVQVEVARGVVLPPASDKSSDLLVDVGGGLVMAVPVDAEHVRVTRLAPVEWPPRPGDLWRDDDEGVWFAHLYQQTGPYARTELRLIPTFDSGGGRYSFPDRLLAERGPLRLVHREQVDPAGDEATGDRS